MASKAAANATKTVLVFGATGRAGSCVVNQALAKGWRVVAFVRSPSKMESLLDVSTSRDKLTIVKGDLGDAKGIADVVKSSNADALVDASSSLPFGTKSGQPKNTADRALMMHAVVEALEADGRTGDCYLLIIGGQLVPEPGGKINSWLVSAISGIVSCLAGKAWKDMLASIDWLFNDTPASFRFTMLRMGHMVEEPSRGVLRVETTENNIQKGKVSYTDVAGALLELAAKEPKQWNRKAVFLNYAK